MTAGILVHRLFESGRVAERLDADALGAHARDLLRPEERAAIDNVDAVVSAAIAAWQAIRARPDVAELFSSGECSYEVPFSMRHGEGTGTVVLRGTIDCLVRRNDGSVAVLEFKTGNRRTSHQEQLALYVEAARTLFPGAPVVGHLIYADA